MTICQACPQEFIKQRMGQRVCSPRCAMRLLKAVKAADRQETKRRKEAVKTRSDWMKEAQVEFNRYIRLRDAGKPCICCGQPLEAGLVGGGYDSGHYRSVGSAPHLRFSEHNAHAQAKKCNRYGAGRAVDYRIGLIARIGLPAVEEIEADQSSPKFTIDDLKAIKTKYRAMSRAIEKELR